MSPLELAVIKTLAWFDLGHQPLTTWEIWFYLWDEGGTLAQVGQSEVLAVLEKLNATSLVTNNLGYWQLSSSPDYLSGRLRRFRWTINQRRRANRAVSLIKRLPFVRLVGLANTAAWDMAARDSDIDFFIITQAGHIFTARFLVTALMQILGWRRHRELISNRICLSFYLADDNLNLRPLAYRDDPYLRFWLAGLYVLYDDGIYQPLVAANDWVSRELLNWWPVASKQILPVNALQPVRSGIVERLMTKWQMGLIYRHKDSRLGDGSTAVLANRQILKFHEGDARVELAAKFRQRLAEVIAGS